MRCSGLHLLPTALLFSLATAIQLPQLQPFLSAIDHLLDDYFPQSLSNSTAHDLLKRQSSDTCPSSFKSCANLGAPNLCCVSNAVCSADYAGHVACCPSGAACTGTITGVIYSGTVDGNGGLVGATAGSGVITSSAALTTSFQPATATGNGLVVASTTAATAAGGGGFIIDGSSTVASPNGAGRGVQLPFIARAIIRALEYLPV